MFRKILIFIAVVIVLALIANVVLSWYASRYVESKLRETISYQSDGQFDIFFESTEVNTISSNVTIKGLSLSNRADKSQIHIGSLSYNLPYGEFFEAARAGGNPVENINSGSVNINGFNYHSEDMGGTMSMSSARINFTGNLGDLIRAASDKRLPARSHEIDIDAAGITVNRQQGGLATRGVSTDDTIERFSGKVIYDPASGFLFFNDMRAVTGMFNVDFSGSISQPELDIDVDAEPLFVDFSSVVRTRKQIPIGEDDAAINFRSMDIRMNTTIHDLAGLMLAPEDLKVNLETDIYEFRIITPETFRQNYGRTIGFLGAQTDEIMLPVINGKYIISTSQADIEYLSVQTPFANLRLEGALMLNEENFAASEWSGTRLKIKPSTPESRTFINTLMGFFNLKLPQENGDYVLPVRGTVTAPVFPGISG